MTMDVSDGVVDSFAAAFADDTDALGGLLGTALVALANGRSRRSGPVPTGAFRASVTLPEQGVGAVDALSSIVSELAAGSADPTHPHCAGHLHCPPLAVAVAADMAVSALNQSLDSWDQGPAAIEIERRIISELARLVGFVPSQAGGVFTTGGTESNLMGLLLSKGGRIYCSELAHFSVSRGGRILGLDDAAIVRIETDANHRLDPGALKTALSSRQIAGEIPVVVATAGTTEFGSIDPLDQIADIASEFSAWLHVDAAYGGGALFSDRLAAKLSGLSRADSISLDFHKFGWQPCAAGVFLAKRSESFAGLEHNVAYLNAPDDVAAGFDSPLGRSLRTTRRADAVKVAITLNALGRVGVGKLVDRCHDLACYAAECIETHPQLRLLAEPVLSTVVFSYGSSDDLAVNAELRRRLLRSGSAVLGRVDRPEGPALKLTFLEPRTTRHDIDRLLDLVVTAGAEVDA